MKSVKRALKEFAKNNKSKLIGYPIAIVVIGVLVFLAWHFGTKTTAANIEEIIPYQHDPEVKLGVKTLSNGSLTLVFDQDTTQFTLTDKDGNRWYSSAQVANKSHKELEALMIVKYKNSAGNEQTLDSFVQCIERNNFTSEVDEANNTVTIKYTIGKISHTYLVPEVITKERYEEIIGGFQSEKAEENLKTFKDCYIEMTWKRAQGKNYKSYLEKYPKIKTPLEKGEVETLYVRRDGYQGWKLEILEEILKTEIDYTKEEWIEDQREYVDESAGVTQPAYNVTMILKLEGDDLVVEVPYDQMQFRSDYPMTELIVLPYMMSEPATSDGYMFVPDGSGAIINFNGKKSQQTYTAKIYGTDYCMTRVEYVSDPLVNYPVYGIAVTGRGAGEQKETLNQSMLAMIEKGESYGIIKSNVVGSLNVNYVYTTFSIIHNEEVNVGKRSTGNIYGFEQELAKDESIVIRYRSLSSSNYVDMAKAYRDYYLERNPEFKNSTVSGDLPVAVELVGAIDKVQHVLGFPKVRPFALTTYEQMADIVKDLNDSGFTNMSVVLEGWFNDGVRHDPADDVSLIRVLGGKSAFNKAVSSIQDAGNKLYLKAGFTYVYDNGLFDSFQYRRDTAKSLSREFMKMQDFSKVWYGVNEGSEYYYLANPGYVEKTMRGYVEEIKDLGLSNIAFTDIGNSLSSDFNRKKTVTREKARDGQVSVLDEIVNGGSKIVMYDPFDYAVAKADLILDMDVDSDHHSLLDESIPFFPIVLHGLVEYTGDALNVTADFTNNLLNCAETGAGLYFTFMHNEGMDLAESDYTYLFGANYDSWKNDAIKWYQRFKTDFAGTYGAEIEDHQIIASGIRMTKFSNGTTVYVNYRTADYKLENGDVIPAQDWIIR